MHMEKKKGTTPVQGMQRGVRSLHTTGCPWRDAQRKVRGRRRYRYSASAGPGRPLPARRPPADELALQMLHAPPSGTYKGAVRAARTQPLVLGRAGRRGPSLLHARTGIVVLFRTRPRRRRGHIFVRRGDTLCGRRS